MTILITLLVYFGVLLVLSRLTTRHSSNDTFYRGNRQSPWPLVAFGMVGASISGVTFISVPGMAVTTQFTYLQMCLGFAVGYVVVAFVLPGSPTPAALRAAVGASLGIGYGNAKQFVYRLNHYGISKDDFHRAAQEALDGLEVKK